MKVEELKRLLEKCDDGLEVVCAWGWDEEAGAEIEALKIDPDTQEVELWIEHEEDC